MNSTIRNAVAFGEILWDVYPDYRKLGGAPLNVLGHLQQLGLKTSIVSRVGEDVLGKEMLLAIDAAGVNRNAVQLDQVHPTGVVNVQLDSAGKPSYEILQPAAWDMIEPSPELEKLVNQSDVFICGSLASRSSTSRSTLHALLRESSNTIFDLNLRLNFYTEDLIREILSQAQILKVNDEEFDVLSQIFSVDKSALYPFLCGEYDLRLIIQTRGADGAEAFDGNSLIEHPGYTVTVVDTVGSGDAFLAGFLSKHLESRSVYDCLDFGCKLGAFVATQEGAIPSYQPDQI